MAGTPSCSSGASAVPELGVPDPAGPETGQLLPKRGQGWMKGQTEMSPGGARTAPHT